MDKPGLDRGAWLGVSSASAIMSIALLIAALSSGLWYLYLLSWAMLGVAWAADSIAESILRKQTKSDIDLIKKEVQKFYGNHLRDNTDIAQILHDMIGGKGKIEPD